ncbi:TPA: hypothetical protein U1617_000363 [Streptococcus suis]|nr:hypothetical protein [Streptococcus suis]HEM5489846.1 hypothetical protein [Streptococcus suis]
MRFRNFLWSKHFFIIKPNAIKRGLVGQILSRVERRGFVIRDLNMMTAMEDLVGSRKELD